VDQQATRRPGIQSGATIDSSCLKGSQGVTPFLKVTDLDTGAMLLPNVDGLKEQWKRFRDKKIEILYR
jgi:hypothetical protein